ncbi:MAG TPA: cytidylate kinase-like family protein [Verrucomicrobiae bacterium]
MWKNINIEECLSHIKRQLDGDSAAWPEIRPAITISRMCGSGGRTVASKLAEYLEPHAPYGHRWTIFDRNLIKKVLTDHWESVRLAEFLTESSKPLLADVLEKLRGKKSIDRTVVEQTVETIWQLAVGGYVIIVGRAGNVITARLPNVFHVRLVGSLENRIARCEEIYDLDRTGAITFIKAQDEAKRSYLKEYFGKDIDDPQLYHLIVNTDRISYGDAAQLIGDAVVDWLKLTPASCPK